MSEKLLRIYFTSDLHAHIYPTDYRDMSEKNWGLFKCASHFKKDGNTIIIDGGDLLQGSPFGTYCHDSLGDASILSFALDCCGYDYITLGNHDFNYGMDYLNSYLNALHARCVCENIFKRDGSACFPAKIHELENGLRVGIVGIITDYVNVWEREEHLAGICITDPIIAARTALDNLREKVDLTVCVYHGGFERDLSNGKLLSSTSENVAYRICQELDFDILLTGHQHMTILGQTLNGTFVVQPTDCGKEFVELLAIVDRNGKHIKSRHIPADGICSPELLYAFRDADCDAQAWMNEVVGCFDKPLYAAEPLAMAANGNRIADFFNMVQLSASGADISATSLANDICGFPKLVCRRDILTAYPYTNTLSVLQINGAILRQAMERSAAYFDVDKHGALCISEQFLKPKIEHYNYDYYAGVDYAFDVSRPIGNRVAELTFHGKPVADTDTFSICLNSYRASGTGGYECYTDCQVLREINKEMSDLMLDYFGQTPKADIEKQGIFCITGIENRKETDR